jgi:hypothetical protein
VNRPLSPLTMLLSRHTRRREVIRALGVASLVTVVRRAESADQRRLVAIMSGFSEPEMRVPLQAFHAKLREHAGRESLTYEDRSIRHGAISASQHEYKVRSHPSAPLNE